jgi:hypothetical protein
LASSSACVSAVLGSSVMWFPQVASGAPRGA